MFEIAENNSYYCPGSIPLHIRRKYLTKKEVLKAYEFSLPLHARLNDVKDRLVVSNLTYLERNCTEISALLNEICHAKITALPPKQGPMRDTRNIIEFAQMRLNNQLVIQA